MLFINLYFLLKINFINIIIYKFYYIFKIKIKTKITFKAIKKLQK